MNFEYPTKTMGIFGMMRGKIKQRKLIRFPMGDEK